MLGKILNIGKSNGFYLTIDETKETISPVTETVKEVTEVIKSEATSETNTKVEAVAKTEPKQDRPKASNKTAKAKSPAVIEQKSEKQPVVSVNATASSWEEPFWVKAMYSNEGSSNTANGTTNNNAKTFATDYLMVQSTSRRRPGPSLDKFKNLVNKKRF